MWTDVTELLPFSPKASALSEIGAKILRSLKRVTLGPIRILILPDPRVVLLRFAGSVTGPDIVAAFQQIMTKDPETLSFGWIIDIRHWAGFLLDEHMAEVCKFFSRHKPDQDPGAACRAIVYLSDHGTGFASRVTLTARLPKPLVVRQPYQAWQIIADDDIIPRNVASFFQ